ncbi:MAG: glycine--tRNA ligase subunit beta [Acetobacteraceae bacterium]|nr:glycine--tRNA ligase subunit beta [Acetobacteraceae bacterium]
MAELFIELFSEEIPARMQARAAADLGRLIAEALAALTPDAIRTFHGPRRIALAAQVAGEIPPASSFERGPRANAPEQALAGFMRKHGATREELRLADDYWVLERQSEATPASRVIAAAMPGLLRRFPWPKSMRWGDGSAFTWVRPLRRIICLLDGAVVPFDLRDGDDDGHGLCAADITEGHRFHSPEPVAVTSCDDWQLRLARRDVIADAAERQRAIAIGLEALAGKQGLRIVPDEGLLAEVAGLVEWPVPLLGRIDPAYMDLPPEVLQFSMRVNQRYFALRDADGNAAPWFAFVANIAAEDGGRAIVAGNERVLRARFADARHFWDADRRTRLADRVPALDAVTFHAKLGTQGDRVRRLVRLAPVIAYAVGADPALAERAAQLAKADLVTAMVGEFPELQGVMGGYYARHDGEDSAVADAVRDHYAPKGPADAVPDAPVSVAIALADKLDQLVAFFAIGEKPTGSGDPYALRRAALGVVRLVRDNGLRVGLLPLIEAAAAGESEAANEVFQFLIERLRVQLRAEGARHDVLAAVFAAGKDDDIVRLLARADAVTALLASEDGANLLTAYKRAANIGRIEDKKDGPHTGEPDPALLRLPEEQALAGALRQAQEAIGADLAAEHFTGAMSPMARLRAPLDAFFDKVTVNAPQPELRRNRLRLLAQVRATMDEVADFSRIEG